MAGLLGSDILVGQSGSVLVCVAASYRDTRFVDPTIMFAFTLAPTFSSRGRHVRSRPDSFIAVFVPEIVWPGGAVLESVSGQVSMLAIIYRSIFTRLLAALIVVLVVSPYSEPFATITGTDFGGAGAVDVGGASKLKTSTLDALLPVPIVVVLPDVLRSLDIPILSTFVLDSRGARRAILRL